VDLNLVHTGDVRPSQVLYELTSHLVLYKWREPDQPPQLHLFGQLKRIAKQWLDTCLVCKGGTYPAQLKYKTLADTAANRITAAINRAFVGEHPIKALLDPYNPTGSTRYVNFTTSRRDRWETAANRCHINWIILDSDWEAEFCRVAESHPQVRSYVKNHNLGLEVPYRFGSENRIYRPDFIIRVDDGRGDEDLLNLVVEIKGYRREDAKEKKSTMETYWTPGVNHLGTHGRWSFAEFTDVYEIQAEFAAKVESEFNKMIESRSHSSTIGNRSLNAQSHCQSETEEISRDADPRRSEAEKHPDCGIPVRPAKGTGRSENRPLRAQPRPRPAARMARERPAGLERSRR
jgi:type III restriction enzyme